MTRRPPRSTRTDTLFPYTTLFRSRDTVSLAGAMTTSGTADEGRPVGPWGRSGIRRAGDRRQADPVGQDQLLGSGLRAQAGSYERLGIHVVGQGAAEHLAALVEPGLDQREHGLSLVDIAGRRATDDLDQPRVDPRRGDEDGGRDLADHVGIGPPGDLYRGDAVGPEIGRAHV